MRTYETKGIRFIFAKIMYFYLSTFLSILGAPPKQLHMIAHYLYLVLTQPEIEPGTTCFQFTTLTTRALTLLITCD